MRVDHPGHDGEARAVDAPRRAAVADGRRSVPGPRRRRRGRTAPRRRRRARCEARSGPSAPSPCAAPACTRRLGRRCRSPRRLEIASSSTMRGKPSSARTGPTRPRDRDEHDVAGTPAISPASSGTGPHSSARCRRRPGRSARSRVPVDAEERRRRAGRSIAGQFAKPVSSHAGTAVSGREMRNQRGSRKWSTAMIIVAHGTVIARKRRDLEPAVQEVVVDEVSRRSRRRRRSSRQV